VIIDKILVIKQLW